MYDLSGVDSASVLCRARSEDYIELHKKIPFCVCHDSDFELERSEMKLRLAGDCLVAIKKCEGATEEMTAIRMKFMRERFAGG
jgi:hypothetical protein